MRTAIESFVQQAPTFLVARPTRFETLLEQRAESSVQRHHHPGDDRR